MRRAVPMILTALLLAGCSGAGGDPDPSATSPLPGPTVTVPGLGIEIDVEEFLSCLSDGGIDVEPVDEPRAGAHTEIDLSFQGEQTERTVLIFVYDDAEAASAARVQVESEAGAPQQVGNVLVTGLLEAVQDPAVAQQGGIVLGCLGDIDLSPSA